MADKTKEENKQKIIYEKVLAIQKERKGENPEYTVDEYKNLLAEWNDNGTVPNNVEEKYFPAPIDGIKLSDLQKYTDEQIKDIANDAGKIEGKNLALNMYERGYAFQWHELKVVAKYRGLISDGKRNPTYTLPTSAVEDDTEKTKTVTGDGTKTVYIKRGRREYETKLLKREVSTDTFTLVQELFKRGDGKPIPIQLQSKIFNTLLNEYVRTLLEMKRNGKLVFKIEAIAEETLE